MSQVTSKLAYNLQELAPHERLKYIRKMLLELNQDEFCADGNISLYTLKHIERGSVPISDKMNSKLLYQLQIFGIKCNQNIFFDPKEPISIDIDQMVKENNFSLSHDLVRFNDRIKQLKAIKVEESCYEPFIKQGSMIFIDTNKRLNLTLLRETLCIIEASETKVFFLTYTNKGIIAKFNDEEFVLSTDTLKMCKVYTIDVIFYG